MLDRVTFIRRYDHVMTRGEIEELVIAAHAEYFQLGITGAMVATPFSIIQMVEGPRKAVDTVLSSHPNATVVACRHDEERRLFSSTTLMTAIIEDERTVFEIERRLDDAHSRGDENACEALLYRAIAKEQRSAA